MIVRRIKSLSARHSDLIRNQSKPACLPACLPAFEERHLQFSSCLEPCIKKLASFENITITREKSILKWMYVLPSRSRNPFASVILRHRTLFIAFIAKSLD